MVPVFTHNNVTCIIAASLCLALIMVGSGREAYAEEASTEGGDETESPTPEEPTAPPPPTDGSATDEEELARARTLFREGVELSDQGSMEQAAERFEGALELHDAPTIRFNLAATYVELERRADAAQQLTAVASNPETPDELRTRAEEMLAEVEGQMGRVLLTRSGLDWNATVTLDGRELDAEELDSPLHADPGSHEIVVMLEERELLRRTVEISAGATVELELIPERTDVENAVVESTEDDDEGTPLIRDWRLWTGVGAGVVVIVTAIVLGVTLSDNEEYEDPVQGNMAPGVLTWP
jgi:hypothetical protein